MQAQAIQETPTETAPDISAGTAPGQPRRVAAQAAPQEAAPPRVKAKPGEPSPARILTEAFEDLRRRMATLEGRIVEGSRAGEVIRIAETLKRVESRLDDVAAAPRGRDGGGKLLITLWTFVAFGTGIVAADHAPQLLDSSAQITLLASNFWQAASDRIGDLRTQ